ncbi:MAG TPA: cohesin domain-containing protein, partial [Candidatus Kryptonia bacterium]|nr:cohesin domain-containing protein [Candidatus Kryptonia bacterium]
RPLATANPGCRVSNLSLSADGSRVAFSTWCDAAGSRDVFLVDATTAALQQITPTENCASGSPTLSRDGRFMVFDSICNPTGDNVDGSNAVYRLDVAGGGFTRLTTEPGCFTGTAINSDGSRIAFDSVCDLTGGSWNAYRIYLSDTTTSALTPIAASGCAGSAPTLDASGAHLAFSSNCDLLHLNPDGNFELYSFDVASGAVSSITTTRACSSFNPVFSGDGTRIAFDSTCDLIGQNPDGNLEIYVLDSANGGFIQITHTTDCANALPTMDQTGNRLAFQSTCDLTSEPVSGGFDVFVATVDATAAVPPSGAPTVKPTATPSPGASPATPSADQTPVLRVASAHGRPGDSVEVGVSLATAGAGIAGVQNDLIFDPQVFSFGDTNGRPTCHANSAIHKSGTVFSFPCQSSGGCDQVRAIVISLDSSDAIADGAVLYTCTIQIAADAAPGHYSLHITETGAGNPSGNRVDISGIDGEIVVDPLAAQAAQAAAASSPSTASGCAIDAGQPRRCGWMWHTLALLIAVRRRRLRP